MRDRLLRAFFTDVAVFSQFQHFHRDALTKTMDLALGDSMVRQTVRAAVPRQLKDWIRSLIHAKGRYRESAYIVGGRLAHASVQVAVCL